MITLENLLNSTPGRGPNCAYCDSPIEDPALISVALKDGDYGDPRFFLHKNCVVAFATRILNEFDKL